IEWCRYSPVVWLHDASGFYFVRRLPSRGKAARQIMHHTIGQPCATDSVVFPPHGASENGAEMRYGISLCPLGRLLSISSSLGLTQENRIWFADITSCPPENPDFRKLPGLLRIDTLLRKARAGLPPDERQPATTEDAILGNRRHAGRKLANVH